MEKKPKKTKALKVEIENKELNSVDPVVELVTELPKLDPKGIYEFVSNGTFKTLPLGKLWKVTGETAMIFLKKGYGKLKD